MSFTACRAALSGASLLALAACATAPATTVTPSTEPAAVVAPVRESTAFTLGTDQPRTPEQLAMQFDKADLSIKVIPDDKAIDAVAVLDFTATAPLSALVVELDTLLTVSSVQVDGREVAGWTNPEGRMTIPLPRPLAAGEKVSVRIAYAGLPRTPVVMLTANALPEHIAMADAAGADRHLAKPFDAAELLELVITLPRAAAEAIAA